MVVRVELGHSGNSGRAPDQRPPGGRSGQQTLAWHRYTSTLNMYSTTTTWKTHSSMEPAEMRYFPLSVLCSVISHGHTFLVQLQPRNDHTHPGPGRDRERFGGGMERQKPAGRRDA